MEVVAAEAVEVVEVVEVVVEVVATSQLNRRKRMAVVEGRTYVVECRLGRLEKRVIKRLCPRSLESDLKSSLDLNHHHRL